jgi:DNA-binding transcriptional MerR regulator
MDIKEIVKSSGVDRGTIRFYEKEGLITPRESEDGRKDYSEEDLQRILRIKLLIGLLVPVEDVKGLVEGTKELKEVLEAQIEKLEKETFDVAFAPDICRAVLEENVSFDRLDAKKYIRRIQKEVEEKYRKKDEKKEATEGAQKPWLRFLARLLDYFSYEVLWSVLLVFVFHVRLSDRSVGGNILDTAISVILMLLIEPLWLRFIGTTLGKGILGIRITAKNQEHLTYKQGFIRTWKVIGSGLGYLFPIYNLVCLWRSYKMCSAKETLPQDKEVRYTVKKSKWFRGILYILVFWALIALLLTSDAYQKLPPHRRDLTEAKFSENREFYAMMLTDENMLNSAPEYELIIEGGYVTGIVWETDIRNTNEKIYSYDAYMIPGALALLGAQDEAGLFSEIPDKVKDFIASHPFENFEIEEAGIRIKNEVTYSGLSLEVTNKVGKGYSKIVYCLYPEEYEPENRYFQRFAVMKADNH